MKCPECKGAVHVVETRNVRTTNVFRLRECKECGHRFFTLESIMTEEHAKYDQFMRDWLRYNRNNLKEKNYGKV